MRLLLTLSATTAFIFWLSQNPASAGLVNGSFEDVDVPDNWYTTYPQGSTTIGWTVSGTSDDAVSVVDTGFTQSGIAFKAKDGKQWIDLAGYSSNSQSSGISQDVTTAIGVTYALSFYVGSATDNVFFFPASVDVSINDGPRTRYTNPATPTNMLDWRQFTHIFTAPTATTKISFYNGGASNNYNSSLDLVELNPVAVSAVPEPATLIIFATGALGVFGAQRRRRSA